MYDIICLIKYRYIVKATVLCAYTATEPTEIIHDIYYQNARYLFLWPQTQQLNDHGAAGRVSREKKVTTMGDDVDTSMLLYIHNKYHRRIYSK